MNAHTLPDVLEHLDYRAWLSEWFKAKKEANPRFSHRGFVRRTGQKSPSLLADVIAGRRNLTPVGVDGFVRALKLEGERARWFRQLVAMDQAPTAAERAELLQRLLATRHYRESHRLDGPSLAYLSHWYYPAIHELAGCAGFRSDPAWIAKTLRPRISMGQAREALELLGELGLLVQDADGGWVQGPGSLTTPHQMQALVAAVYHQHMSARAAEALEGSKASERHYCGLTVSIPTELLPELKRELDAVQERLLARCDAAPDPDQVVQINLQLFPLSHPTSEPE